MEKETANESAAQGQSQIKQAFLASAIADISSYIHLADAKVSLLMTAVVALVVGIMTCYEFVEKAIARISPCSWLGVLLVVLSIAVVACVVGMFVFCILTIRGHNSKIDYKSKWFLAQPTQQYSFEAFKSDVNAMTDCDVVENMAAELYKLNDINRQKKNTCAWAVRLFSASMALLLVICVILLSASLGGC